MVSFVMIYILFLPYYYVWMCVCVSVSMHMCSENNLPLVFIVLKTILLDTQPILPCFLLL
jgi:hypothetical protein